MRIGTFKPLIILCVWCRNRKNSVSSSLALRKNASVQNRCKGEKVSVPYASEKGPLFGKERALNEIKTTAAESRGDIRKRRRKRSAFAGLQRQSPLTTTKGACGSFPCTPIKIGPFPVLRSSAPGFWMQKVRKGAAQALVACPPL